MTEIDVAIVWVSFAVVTCLIMFLFFRIQVAEARIKTLEIEMRICKSKDGPP